MPVVTRQRARAASKTPKDELAQLYASLTNTLTWITAIESMEADHASDARKVMATAFFAQKSFFPIRIWMVTIYHKRTASRCRVNNDHKRSHDRCYYVELPPGEKCRVRGTYITFKDALNRARILQKEAADAGKTIDEEEEDKFRKSEGFQWAMVTETDEQDSGCEKRHSSLLRPLHRMSCYISSYEVDGPGCTGRADDKEERLWGSDSETDAEIDDNRNAVPSDVFEYEQ